MEFAGTLFYASSMPWPHTIPHDLKLSLEATQTQEGWWQVFRGWAKNHGLRLKLQWIRGLSLDLAELDRRRSPPTEQDRWGVIKEWLEQHRVEAPDRLPIAPEIGSGRLQ